MHIQIGQRNQQKDVLRLVKQMQINTPQETYLRPINFQILSPQDLSETLLKWLNESKKNKKESSYHSLFYNLGQLLMPDVETHQLLVHEEFFVDKVYHMLGLCKFRSETLFNGVEIKVNEAFVAFDVGLKLEKVVLQGSQIKEITPLPTQTLIRRGDTAFEDRKQKLFIYNREKYQKTTYLTVDVKALERTKNDLFKEDHSNKLRFFNNFIFGQVCPSFCVSGINIMEVKENEWLKEKTHLSSTSVYIIFSGTFICFLENQKISRKDNFVEGNKQVDGIVTKQTDIQTKKLRRNHSVSSQGPRADGPMNQTSKIELNKGSIIQTDSFVEIMNKIDCKSSYKFQSCKAITKSIVFEIKSTEFYKAFSLDQRCKKYFLSQYEKVLLSRKLLFSQSFDTLKKFFSSNEQPENEEFGFSISRRKSYKGFRKSRTARSSLDDMQNLATVEIYDTMIKNKQKVLSLQKQYKEKHKSSQKTNLRYEDNKKMIENYKRMKIKDFQIQKLVFRNSTSSPKDLDGFKNMKSRMNQVKGMFEDEIEEVEKVIKQQRKAMLEVQMNKQNKNFKRKGIRLKSYSPQQTNSYQNISLNYTRTCTNSKRVSLGQGMFSEMLNHTKQDTCSKRSEKSDTVINSTSTIRAHNHNQKKTTTSNLVSTVDIVINGGQSDSKKFLYNPAACVNNMTQRDTRRTGKRAKTNFKQQVKRMSGFVPDSSIKVSC